MRAASRPSWTARTRSRTSPSRWRDLECDYYGTSLHKWLLAPVGTGFLYVRKARIAKRCGRSRPPTSKLTDDIRKFEEIGTHPAAAHNAIAEALEFHQAIGAERKAARLRFLKDRWARRFEHRSAGARAHQLRSRAGVRDRQSVHSTGAGSGEVVADSSGAAHRIFVTPIKHDEFQGLRVTPNVYTTLDEIDTFSQAIDEVLARGIPTS